MGPGVLDNGMLFPIGQLIYALDFLKKAYLIYHIKKIIEGEGTADEKIKG
jgi:hypothetical protein